MGFYQGNWGVNTGKNIRCLHQIVGSYWSEKRIVAGQMVFYEEKSVWAVHVPQEPHWKTMRE